MCKKIKEEQAEITTAIFKKDDFSPPYTFKGYIATCECGKYHFRLPNNKSWVEAELV